MQVHVLKCTGMEATAVDVGARLRMKYMESRGNRWKSIHRVDGSRWNYKEVTEFLRNLWKLTKPGCLRKRVEVYRSRSSRWNLM